MIGDVQAAVAVRHQGSAAGCEEAFPMAELCRDVQLAAAEEAV